MKTALIIWGILIVACIIEAFTCTDWDPETRKYLDNREKNQKK
tara:strand:- start:350 stop:478 length:129 start_codon:yes stop_codon:yes gene_type:complete